MAISFTSAVIVGIIIVILISLAWKIRERYLQQILNSSERRRQNRRIILRLMNRNILLQNEANQNVEYSRRSRNNSPLLETRRLTSHQEDISVQLNDSTPSSEEEYDNDNPPTNTELAFRVQRSRQHRNQRRGRFHNQSATHNQIQSLSCTTNSLSPDQILILPPYLETEQPTNAIEEDIEAPPEYRT